jgi:hypothetical protein
MPYDSGPLVFAPPIDTIAALRAYAGVTMPLFYVVGYYAPGDGGDGLFAYVATDTASADNGGTIIVDAAGRRWHRESSGDPVRACWFGAKGDGSTDDTAALRAAITACGSGTLELQGNAGDTFMVSGVLTISQPHLTIYGPSATITTNSATADVFVVNADFFELHGVTITASVTRTAGAYVNFNGGNYGHIHDFTITAFFVGVLIGNVNTIGAHLSHGRLQLGVAGTASGIVVNGGVDHVLDNLWIVGGSGANLANGVVINACGDITLDHVSTVYAGNGLAITPATGAIAQVVMVSDSYFDSGSGSGIYVAPGGAVQALKLSNVWSASNAGGGLTLSRTGTGTVAQVDAVGCVFANSTGTTTNGVTINPGVGNATLSGCTMGSNTGAGVFIAAAVSAVKVLGCTLGVAGQFVGNTLFGVTVGAGCTNIVIANNIFAGNGSGAVGIAGADLASTANFVHDNAGFAVRNRGQATLPAGTNTSVVVNHGLIGQPASVTLTSTATGLPVVVTATATTLTIVVVGTLGGPLLVYWGAYMGPNS